MASFGQSGGSANKITKARGKMVMVKPILKKLPRSEKNSLDLDRGWDEQQVEQLENNEWDGGYGYGYGYGGQARDVSFGLGGGPGDGGSGGGGGSFRAKLQHGRSGSQTSTASGGPRAGFVHPFAQTPRTSTPPLSYANSLASFDNGRDCSPTITEAEDDDSFDTSAYPHPHPHSHSQPITISQSSNLRRPSLNSSQRTSSFPEPPPKPPSLRVNTTSGRSVSGTTTTSSRLAHGSFTSTGSHSDLHLNHSHSHSLGGGSTTLESPTGSFCGVGTSTPLHVSSSTPPPHQPPPPPPAPSSGTSMSPLRTSLDLATAGFPRLRSRSELDTATRVENIRAARRKFEERERVKEEKYDREMIRKRERRDNKEACRIEKGEVVSGGDGAGERSSSTGLHRPPAPRRRITPTGLGLSIGSSASAPPGVGGRKSPGLPGMRSSSPYLGLKSAASAPVGAAGLAAGIGRRRHTDSPAPAEMEEEKQPQMGFASRKYESVPVDAPPAFGPGPAGVEDVRFEQMPPRRGSAKRKTQGYWQGFLLWLRTKLLRLGGR